MKKEVFLTIFSAIVGGGATMGFNIVQAKYFTDPAPISVEVASLSNINREISLQQKSLIKKLDELAITGTASTELSSQIQDIKDRISSFTASTNNFLETSNNFSSLALSIRDNINSSYFNSTPDLQLRIGQAATVCGKENTVGVIRESNSDNSVYISVNSRTDSAFPGEEYRFKSPIGNSMISYLGKDNSLYKFRITCDIATKI